MLRALIFVLTLSLWSLLPAGRAAAQDDGLAGRPPVAGPYACAAEQAARAYLAAAWPEATFVLHRRTTMAGTHYLDFRQRHQGLPVVGPVLTVALGAGCTVVAAGGRPAGPHLDTRPRLSPDEARQRAAAVYTAAQQAPEPPELLILPRPGGGRLVYLVRLPGEVVLVDAHAGLIEAVLPRGAHGVAASPRPKGTRVDGAAPPARPAATAHAEGIGHAFPGDPGAGAYEVLTLPRLHGDGLRLDGQYVRVSSDRLQPDGQPTPSLDGSPDYRYLPIEKPDPDCIARLDDCSDFDAVNIYYHIDRFAHTFWVERMGLAVDFQVHAVAHIAGDNAFYDAGQNVIKIGLGEIFLKNMAQEDDVIYHEYSHAVAQHLGFHVGIGSPTQTLALSEGYADYFAATFTDDPRFGEWMVTCPPRLECTGPPNDAEHRILNTDPAVWNWHNGSPPDTLRYGVCTRFHEGDGKCKTSYNNFTDQYVWGMIWSGALWDLRTALGADVADRLVLGGLLLVHADDLTFDAAVEGLFLADAQHFGGQHEAAIEAVLAGRGFMRVSDTAVAPPAVPHRVAALHPVHPNPFRGSAALSYYVSDPGPAALVVYDVLGREVARLADGWHRPGLHHVRWEAAGHASGVYLVTLVTAGFSQARTLSLRR